MIEGSIWWMPYDLTWCELRTYATVCTGIEGHSRFTPLVPLAMLPRSSGLWMADISAGGMDAES
jgi:hypothetical protein